MPASYKAVIGQTLRQVSFKQGQSSNDLNFEGHVHFEPCPSPGVLLLSSRASALPPLEFHGRHH
uniref:Uncharacterized protein n=1 Tax=Anguilla anguilla TaxID=7936 RepID=A0A0E9TKK0_ANGAN